jgi:nucleoside-diphosphate-sugar epimerase
VTGGAGKAGSAVVERIASAGYIVTNVDLTRTESSADKNLVVDLTDLGQVYETLRDADYLVHMAAIVGDDLYPPERIFRNNVLSTYNLFTVACTSGVRKVVWASSETLLGIPFGPENQPGYLPVDEEHSPLPTTHYGLSKCVAEEMTRHFYRWHHVPFVGLRITNILSQADYESFPSYQSNPHTRMWNLWAYVDVRDVAESCLLALESHTSGVQEYIVAAADTVMQTPSEELVREYFPEVRRNSDLSGHRTLLSIDKARKELGFQPRHSWRAYV